MLRSPVRRTTSPALVSPLGSSGLLFPRLFMAAGSGWFPLTEAPNGVSAPALALFNAAGSSCVPARSLSAQPAPVQPLAAESGFCGTPVVTFGLDSSGTDVDVIPQGAPAQVLELSC